MMLKVLLGIVAGMAVVIAPMIYVFNRPKVKAELIHVLTTQLDEAIYGKKPNASPYRKYSDIN